MWIGGRSVEIVALETRKTPPKADRREKRSEPGELNDTRTISPLPSPLSFMHAGTRYVHLTFRMARTLRVEKPWRGYRSHGPTAMAELRLRMLPPHIYLNINSCCSKLLVFA
jgi:hypothetical protein